MPIDLTGKSFNIAQSLIAKGQPLNLDFSVVNNGDEDVAPFSFDIVISRDSEISKDDYVLGNYEIRTGLKAGEDSGIKKYRYFTPSEDNNFWKAGLEDYTVGIRIDPDNQVFESDKENNSNVQLGVDSAGIQVLDFGVAELQGIHTDVGKSGIIPGEKVDLEFTIFNDSPQRANPFSVDIYLSPGPGIGVKEAYKLGTYDIRESIAGNGEVTKRYSYPTPDLGDPLWGKGDGKYYVALDIDSKDEVEETREGNNNRRGEDLDYTGVNVTGVSSAADLIVQNIEIPANAKAGDTIEVKYEIVNNGETDAELFAAGFYLFGDDYLTPDRTSLDIADVPEVFFLQGDNASILNVEAESSTGELTTKVTLPETWGGYSGDGDYYIGVEADPFDDVVESSDANNSLEGIGVDYQKIALDTTVQDTVDLVGTEFKVTQDQIVPGQELELNFNVANKGLGEVETFSVDIYFSEDETITAEDRYLGTYNILDGLGGNDETGLKSIKYSAPDADDAFWGDADGKYYAGMLIDPANDIVETDETNNMSSDSVHVTGLEDIADLKADSLTLSETTVTAGSNLDLSYEISNIGTEKADFFAGGFFIFTEDYLTNNDMLDVNDVPQVYFLPGGSSESVITVEAGESTGVVNTTVAIPETWAGYTGSSDYYIGLAADVYGDILELDESNNSLVTMGVDYQAITIEQPALTI